MAKAHKKCMSIVRKGKKKRRQTRLQKEFPDFA